MHKMNYFDKLHLSHTNCETFKYNLGSEKFSGFVPRGDTEKVFFSVDKKSRAERGETFKYRLECMYSTI